ncbi:hypothetical protein BH20VER1_BH20VER1_25990 [soil metagenome]|jgi:hypothetical protein
MKLKTLLVLPLSVLALHLAMPTQAQAQAQEAEKETPELDGSDVEKELYEREQKIGRLSLEEQLKLRAAQQKAAEDPEVLAALEKRNQALKEFRDALRASMIKTDPSMQVILDKLATGTHPGF